MTITRASQLSDQELTTALKRLAQDEREATVALIVHLAEFEARRLHEAAGFSSPFKYCRAILSLSEDAVYNRIEAARAARRFPVIVDMLRARTLSPTTAPLLARRLTPENHQELLSAASGLGKEDVEELLAARFPEPEVKASVRKVPTASPASVPAVSAAAATLSSAAPGVAGPIASEAISYSIPASARPTVRPVATVRGPLHGDGGNARETEVGTGPARPCRSQRRSRTGVRSGADGAHRLPPRDTSCGRRQGDRREHPIARPRPQWP